MQVLHNLKPLKLTLNVTNAGVDSSFLHIAHNYVKPDGFLNNPQGHKLGNQHYWSVNGKLSNGFHSFATFSFDGNKTIGGTNSYMDTLITIVNSDSVALFYRPNTKSNWVWQKHATKLVGSLRTGYIKVDTLKLGQYCFGNLGDTNLVSISKQIKNTSLEIFPNPTSKKITIKTKDESHLPIQVTIVDCFGKEVEKLQITQPEHKLTLKEKTPGVYLVELITKEGYKLIKKLVIE
jgi:hypothetical protein